MIGMLDRLSATQTLYFLLLFGVGFTFIWLLQFRRRLLIRTPAALGISFLAMATGVVTVKMFAVLENFNNPTNGAISLFGGVFFMPLAFWLGARITKRNIATVFDILTVPLIVAMMCGRTSCLLTGCCEGLPIPGMNGLRWPTRELELFFYIVILAYIMPKVLKGKTYGEIYPLYMMTYGLFRFVIETFRVSYVTNRLFHISHIWAAISFCAGAGIYIELCEKEKKKRRG